MHFYRKEHWKGKSFFYNNTWVVFLIKYFFKLRSKDLQPALIMIKISFFVFAFFASASVLAQQTGEPEDQWTLQECIEYAEKHNLQVKQSELSLLSSKVELERSKADLYPTLNGGSSLSYSVGRTINPVDNEFIDDPVTYQNYSLSSGVTLFNGFSKQNLIKQNKLEFKANELELAGIRNNISMRIASAYLDILFSMELLENAKTQLRTSGLQVERTRKQVEVGTLPQASLYELE